MHSTQDSSRGTTPVEAMQGPSHTPFKGIQAVILIQNMFPNVRPKLRFKKP